MYNVEYHYNKQRKFNQSLRKIKLFIASSLDGFIARENGHIDWLPTKGKSGYDEFYRTVDIVIIGKTTYDQVLTFGEYPYKDKKSYVFTRNNNHTRDENAEFVSDIDGFVNDILPNLDGSIWLIGGAQIISSFVNRGIVDEIILSIVPTVLGKGIPLFQNIQKELKLKLIKTTKYDKLTELHYRVLR